LISDSLKGKIGLKEYSQLYGLNYMDTFFRSWGWYLCRSLCH